jgi:hypothetical protein
MAMLGRMKVASNAESMGSSSASAPTKAREHLHSQTIRRSRSSSEATDEFQQQRPACHMRNGQRSQFMMGMPALTRPQKITFAEMRAPGLRDLLIYCSDYHCSHCTAISGDRWADDVRLSDLEPRFICKACGKRGAVEAYA